MELYPREWNDFGDRSPQDLPAGAADRDLLEKSVKRTLLHEGRIVRLEEDVVELADGSPARREIARHPGAVAVLAYDRGADELVFVRQYRHPVEKVLLEIPAGKLDAGELPLDCARRELAEETGLRAATLLPMHSVYTCVGFSDEVLHLYYSEDFRAGESRLDEGERLHTVRLRPEQAFSLLAAGRIRDGKTQIALYWFMAYRRGSALPPESAE